MLQISWQDDSSRSSSPPGCVDININYTIVLRQVLARSLPAVVHYLHLMLLNSQRLIDVWHTISFVIFEVFLTIFIKSGMPHLIDCFPLIDL